VKHGNASSVAAAAGDQEEHPMAHTNKETVETQDLGLGVGRMAHLDEVTVNIVSFRESHSLLEATNTAIQTHLRRLQQV
jgi:hypothetical protein